MTFTFIQNKRKQVILKSLLVLVFMFLISGCGILHSQFRLNGFEYSPRQKKIKGVPFFPQDAYQCGPASLAMVLAHSGLSITPEELKPQIYTPKKKGSFQVEMMGATRRNHRLALPIKGIDPLIKELAAGHPIIVLQNLGLSVAPKWHYAVVIGYDLDNETITLHTGRDKSRTIPGTLFLRTWKRGEYWGLMVLKPGEVPETLDEKTYLESVLGLEKVQDWKGAAMAYEAALNRWPDSLGALIGLGNSRYSLKDMVGAEKAFIKAMSLHPESAPAYNNLAHIHSENGEFEKAIFLINKAIELGGPYTDLFKQTLEEIKAKQKMKP